MCVLQELAWTCIKIWRKKLSWVSCTSFLSVCQGHYLLTYLLTYLLNTETPSTTKTTFHECRPAVEHASVSSRHVANVGCGAIDRSDRHATWRSGHCHLLLKHGCKQTTPPNPQYIINTLESTNERLQSIKADTAHANGNVHLLIRSN